MNLNLLVLLIPVLCMLAPVAVIFIWLKRQEAADRRTPLTDELLRLPGETLNQQLRETAFDVSGLFFLSVLIPSIGLLTLLNRWIDPERIRLDGTVIFCALLIGAGVLWSLWRTLDLVRKISAIRRGIEGELATAQLLTPLLSEGWQLFHDLPMKRGNIDHVLVGPTGVYAIESKYRSKRQSLKGKEGVQADYDGSAIRFAGGATEQLPVQQAQAVASELSKWLHGKVGEPVSVVPVVALPGWFVRTTQKPANSQVHVINPKVHYLFQKRPFLLEQTLQVRVSAALRELAVQTVHRANK